MKKMKRNDWILAVSPLVAVWTVDRITKLWALTLPQVGYFDGPIGFVLHRNPGVMLGMFSDLPPVLRIVSLSTGGAFLLFLYAIIQFMLAQPFMFLRVGLSFLMGGILGNVTDKIIWGDVVDFVAMRGPWGPLPVFNLADALQWIGYFLIVRGLFKYGHELWPAANLRKSYWINPKFQLKYCFILTMAGLGVIMISGTFSYTFLKVVISELTTHNVAIENRFVYPYLVILAIIGVTFCCMLFVIGMMLSHRAAGPLYAFERFLNDHIEGKKPHLKLRTGDEFKQLEDLANKLTQDINLKSKRS